MVNEQLRRAENRTRDELLCTKNCAGKKVEVPLIVPHHPHLDGLNEIMQKNLNYLQVYHIVRSVLTPAPFVSFPTV